MTSDQTPQDQTKPDSQRIAITGASGLIGSRLTEAFESRGHTVLGVSRSASGKPNSVQWSPRDGQIEADKLEGVDIVVHLAGENLFGLWTAGKKEAILKSRTEGTELLSRTLAGLDRPPRLFVSASAVGYYGDTGERTVDETDEPGDSFLAEVCKQWEAASQPAADAGIRTVNMRLGVVLSTEGGALKVMLTPFKMGLGGRVGKGDQYMSWIVVEDVVGGLLHILEDPDLAGPVNLTSPNPVTNKTFTKTLGTVLGRPTIFPLPETLVKVGAGKMGEEMLLHGQRAVPRRLTEGGFEFEYPDLEAALRHELSK